jgi:thiol:disulfide interchange protein
MISAIVALSLLAGQTEAPKHVIYPDPSVAAKEIKLAIAKARKEHKRIILDFGGNWCGDCVVLDKYFHEEPNASIVKAHFILVDINIGKFDANKDIAKTYGVPLEKGVPALAVLDENGKPLFSQKNGEFESMRRLANADLANFLTHWEP